MDATTPAPSTNPTGESARGGRRPRGNNDVARQSSRNVDGSRPNQGRGGQRGGRGRGRDRSARNDRDNQNPNIDIEALHGPARAQVFLTQQQRPQITQADDTAPQLDASTESAIESEDVEAEVCFICASPVVHNAVAPCNHRTCHICSLRLRALYKTKACAHCRTNAEIVIFTDDPIKRFENFQPTDFTRIDDNLGIEYENNDIYEDTVLLLRYNCPEATCDIACYGWPDLHRHVKSVHQKVMCDLCTRNKKVFTHEHELFTPTELRKHEKFGDDNPGAVDQSGFKGHPECGFCRQRFYGDDELYLHCRDKHERCHLCDRRNAGRSQQYFLDYNALEVHFRKDHFVCPDQECLDKKFVVFDSEMDLKAHQLEAHPNGLSKDARRDARRVDMSGFDLRAPHPSEPRGAQRREGRGRGRGRDPNVDAIPASSAQPLRRDELAYQRQLAIHSAQSISTRTFGGALTSGDAFAARAPANAGEPPTQAARASESTAPPSSAPSAAAMLPTIVSTQDLSPQERARALRHAAVTERAANLLQHAPTKLATFREKVSQYTRGATSASGLIDAFFVLFDAPTRELGTLIKELAEIFEVPGKRDDLLKSWNDWRAINEDYPSLPGPSGEAGPVSLGGAGKRILKLKSSTAQSSRSAVSRHGSWGSNSSGAMPFPAMAAPKGPSAVSASKTPWVTPASGHASGSGTPRITPVSSRPASRNLAIRPAPALRATDAFPALPAAQKPGFNISKNPVLRTDSGRSTPANAWLAGGALVSPPAEGPEEESGKRKGKKKQTLIHWG